MTMTDLSKLRELAEYAASNGAAHIALLEELKAPTVLALLDRLEAAERERDALGKAAFAAVVASGDDTDGATTWESYFRPMKYPSWVDAVHQNVTSLREERDQSDREALAAEAKIARVREYIVAVQNSPGLGDRGHHGRWLREALGVIDGAALQESEGE